MHGLPDMVWAYRKDTFEACFMPSELLDRERKKRSIEVIVECDTPCFECDGFGGFKHESHGKITDVKCERCGGTGSVSLPGHLWCDARVWQQRLRLQKHAGPLSEFWTGSKGK